MDVDSALLIALMYVTIVTMSIGSILTNAAELVYARVDVKKSVVYLNWLGLILFSHFNLFWHTLEILQLEDPSFDVFLLIIAGPIFLFFLTHVFTAGCAEASADLDTFFEDARGRFFGLLICVLVWLVTIDLVLGDGYVMQSAFVTAMIVLAIVLSLAPRKAQPVGVIAGWALVLTSGYFTL